jgi:hypothetical protein
MVGFIGAMKRAVLERLVPQAFLHMGWTIQTAGPHGKIGSP